MLRDKHLPHHNPGETTFDSVNIGFVQPSTGTMLDSTTKMELLLSNADMSGGALEDRYMQLLTGKTRSSTKTTP